MPQDKYANFFWLSQSQGEHFRIERADGPDRSSIAIVAVHGGKIEPGTSELARAIAGIEHPFYLFEGLKLSGNRDLHISSGRFDDPLLDGMLSRMEACLSLHGEASDEEVVYLGGLNREFQKHLAPPLETAGFSVQLPPTPALAGISPFNVCNRPKRHGVQLEISRGLRRRFFASLDPGAALAFTPLFGKVVEALRLGVTAYQESLKI